MEGVSGVPEGGAPLRSTPESITRLPSSPSLLYEEHSSSDEDKPSTNNIFVNNYFVNT